MTHEDCESYRELLAANALTALDAADARALAAHLESCADCGSEANEWEKTAALLALDSGPLEPSLLVRNQILARVRAESRAQSFTGDQVERLVPPQITEVDPKVVPFERPQRDAWASLRSFGAIAAALVFVALISSLMALWQQNRSTRNELARLSTEMRQTQAQLDHERAVVELLTSPNSHMAKLTGTNLAPGAHAMLAYDKSGHAMLMARGLPAAPKGMAYQLWFIAGARPMPGKVFQTDAAGNAMLDDQLPAEALNAATFAVTLERQAGAAAPTGPMYLLTPASS
jgi:hypothetical protein